MTKDAQLEQGWLKRQTLAAAVSTAWDNLRRAKLRMDEAREIFEKTESDWHEACLEHDRLEAEMQAAHSTSTPEKS